MEPLYWEKTRDQELACARCLPRPRRAPVGRRQYGATCSHGPADTLRHEVNRPQNFACARCMRNPRRATIGRRQHGAISSDGPADTLRHEVNRRENCALTRCVRPPGRATIGRRHEMHIGRHWVSTFLVAKLPNLTRSGDVGNDNAVTRVDIEVLQAAERQIDEPVVILKFRLVQRDLFEHRACRFLIAVGGAHLHLHHTVRVLFVLPDQPDVLDRPRRRPNVKSRFKVLG